MTFRARLQIWSLACLSGICLTGYSHADDRVTLTSSTDSKSSAAKVDFQTEVMPVFSRFGCNAAECHGSATGRGDFKLSLFGGDPARDYDSIVNELAGRRINFQKPQKSLLFTKPTEMLAHGGGEVIAPDSKAAKRLIHWIESGAPYGSGIEVLRIRLNQELFRASDAEPDFSIKVTALTSRGEKDVTDDASFASSNPTALTVASSGLVESSKPGKYFIIVKYLQHVSTVTVVRPFPDIADNQGNSSSHPVDAQVQKTLNSLGLKAPATASESAFVRRLYLDLTGLLPTPDEAQEYLNSKDPDKKIRLINRLLASDRFHNYWGYWLRNVIQFRIPGNDKSASQKLDRWLRQSIEQDKSWASTSRELVTATGNTDKIPSANFHRFFADARGEAETVANSFLGFRIGCANCHNHPLDQWTQEDYHGLAAIFATLKRAKTVSEFPGGSVVQPKTGKAAVPRIPGEKDLDGDNDLRDRFAEWMVVSPRFRNSIVNRVWKHLMGRGIVEPVDDFRSSNPPIDGELLNLLAEQFEKQNFRFKPLIRLIVTSDIYASTPQNSSSSDFWTGYRAKTVSPDVYYNTCRQVLYEPEIGGKSRQTLATNSLEIPGQDAPLRLLKGCDPRGDCIAVGESESRFGLREKLHLINGKFLNRWLLDPKNDWRDQLETDADLIKALSKLYWRCFTRPMTEKEMSFWKQQISESSFDKAGKARIRFLEDAIWSLINSTEFRNIQ